MPGRPRARANVDHLIDAAAAKESGDERTIMKLRGFAMMRTEVEMCVEIHIHRSLSHTTTQEMAVADDVVTPNGDGPDLSQG